ARRRSPPRGPPRRPSRGSAPGLSVRWPAAGRGTERAPGPSGSRAPPPDDQVVPSLHAPAGDDLDVRPLRGPEPPPVARFHDRHRSLGSGQEGAQVPSRVEGRDGPPEIEAQLEEVA